MCVWRERERERERENIILYYTRRERDTGRGGGVHCRIYLLLEITSHTSYKFTHMPGERRGSPGRFRSLIIAAFVRRISNIKNLYIYI